MTREMASTRTSPLRRRAEAVHAADVALRHLARAGELLDSASDWGRFDLICGGVVSSLIKHRRIDDAEDEFNAARDALRRFASSLSRLEDVDETIDFEIGGLAGAIDIFADNIFADLYMQAKIERARARVDTAIEQVGEIRQALMDV